MAEVVKGDGFLTAFNVESSFGKWEAVDREMLETRVGEVYALDRLSEVRTIGVSFCGPAEARAGATAESLRGGLTEGGRGPVESWRRGAGTA